MTPERVKEEVRYFPASFVVRVYSGEVQCVMAHSTPPSGGVGLTVRGKHRKVITVPYLNPEYLGESDLGKHQRNGAEI